MKSNAAVKRKTEFFKTALIIVLVACACYLAYRTGAFSTIPDAAVQTNDEIIAFSPALYPVAVVVTGANGRYSAVYDANALGELWGVAAYSLGEALGTAEPPEEVSESEFRRALDSPGICLDYRYPIRADVVIKWLGVSSVREQTEELRLIYLTPAESGNSTSLSLYYIDASGGFRKCATSANAVELTQKLSVYTPNGAYFAYESEIGNNVSPYTLLPDAAPGAVILDAYNPQIPNRDILDAFGMNPFSHGASGLREGDEEVYVEDGIQLRIGSSGRVYFESKRESPDAGNSPAAAIEAAYRLIRTLESGGSVMMTNFSVTETGYEMEFSRFFNGIEILCFESAAKIEYKNGVLSEATINMRSYSATDDAVALLPPRQAAAAAKPGSYGELRIVYVDTGDSAVKPSWTIK